MPSPPKRDDEVEARHELLGVAREVRESGRLRLVTRDSHLDVALEEPRGRRLRERVRERALAVRDQTDCGERVHTGIPATASSVGVVDRHRAATRVGEVLDVAVGTGDRRRDQRAHAEPVLVEAADDFLDDDPPHLGIADDAALADTRPSRLELRLHEQDEVGGSVGEREEVRSDRPQRDERHVDDAEIGPRLDRDPARRVARWSVPSR